MPVHDRVKAPAEIGSAPKASPLGIAGFVLSLIGLIICVVAPIGLVLSLVGLRRPPRGFAIAGTAISGLMTLAMLVVVIQYGPTVERLLLMSYGMELGEKTGPALTAARKQILVSMGEYGDYPTEAEGNAILAGQNDYWGTPVRYERTATAFQIRSAGPDKRYDTWDDLTKDNVGSVLEMDDPQAERRYQAWKEQQRVEEEWFGDIAEP